MSVSKNGFDLSLPPRQDLLSPRTLRPCSPSDIPSTSLATLNFHYRSSRRDDGKERNFTAERQLKYLWISAHKITRHPSKRQKIRAPRLEKNTLSSITRVTQALSVLKLCLFHNPSPLIGRRQGLGAGEENAIVLCNTATSPGGPQQGQLKEQLKLLRPRLAASQTNPDLRRSSTTARTTSLTIFRWTQGVGRGRAGWGHEQQKPGVFTSRHLQ